MPAATRPSRGFRDDIQGMRAFAVLGILVFHLGLSPYTGGFVTLDVFFVLSGFLITTLLLREIDRTGAVDLVAFYARRARRILPAATVTIVGTAVAAALWINPVDAREAAVDGVWAALFGANIRFMLDETDYFALEDSVSPLQHFWSLSVEEQFYLGLPALLLVTVLLARLLVRRRQAGAPPGSEPARTPRRTIAVVLAVVSAVSLGWSVHASHVSPESAYFSTFARIWEFGAGGLLAVVAPVVAVRLGNLHRNALAAAGLALVVTAMFVVAETDPYPGWLALIPVVGTGAVLLAGTSVEGALPLVPRLLGVRPLRVVGDASYSLYLWHWPILVIAQQHVGRPLRLLETGVVLVVTAVMTWASYRFVESPFRRQTVRLSRGLVLYPLAFSLAVGGSLAAVLAADRTLSSTAPPIRLADVRTGPQGKELSPEREVALVEASVKAARDGAPVPGRLRPSLTDLEDSTADMGECSYETPPWKACPRGDEDGDRTLVVLGDSHGRHWIPALEKLAKREGYRTHYLVKPQCTPARVKAVLNGKDRPEPECSDFNRWAMDELEELDPDHLVVSTTAAARVWVDGRVVSDKDGVDRAVRRGFEQLFADVRPLADEVSLLVDVPTRSTRPPQCLGARDTSLADCLDEPRAKRARASRISAEAAREAGVDVVPTKQWLCADGVCPAVVGDMVAMRDTGHLTTEYAEHLADALGRRLGLGRR